MSDRTVHGVSQSGWEIVRYDRAGKWYFESTKGRTRVTIDHAAKVAAVGTFHPGLPGGSRFDKKVREMRGGFGG